MNRFASLVPSLLTGFLATSLLFAEEPSADLRMDPVNFQRIKVVDRDGDSYEPASEVDPQRSYPHFAVRDLVLEGKFEDAMAFAFRQQDPNLRRRLSLGIVNHLCQASDFGRAMELASYRVPERDIQSLCFLVIAIKQKEQGLEVASVTYEKAKKTASKIEDSSQRSEVMAFVRGIHL